MLFSDIGLCSMSKVLKRAIAIVAVDGRKIYRRFTRKELIKRLYTGLDKQTHTALVYNIWMHNYSNAVLYEVATRRNHPSMYVLRK